MEEKKKPNSQQQGEVKIGNAEQSDFMKLFETNLTINILEMNFNIKQHALFMQKKTKPTPLHIQVSIAKKNKYLTHSNHIEQARDIKSDNLN